MAPRAVRRHTVNVGTRTLPTDANPRRLQRATEEKGAEKLGNPTSRYGGTRERAGAMQALAAAGGRRSLRSRADDSPRVHRDVGAAIGRIPRLSRTALARAAMAVRSWSLIASRFLSGIAMR